VLASRPYYAPSAEVGSATKGRAPINNM